MTCSKFIDEKYQRTEKGWVYPHLHTHRRDLWVGTYVAYVQDIYADFPHTTILYDILLTGPKPRVTPFSKIWRTFINLV